MNLMESKRHFDQEANAHCLSLCKQRADWPLFFIVSSNNCVSSAVAEDEKLRSSINFKETQLNVNK